MFVRAMDGRYGVVWVAARFRGNAWDMCVHYQSRVVCECGVPWLT